MAEVLTPVIREGKIEGLKAALSSKRYDVNKADDDGYLPLYLACMKAETLPMVSHLLAAGAAVEGKGTDRETALYIAAFNGFVSAVQQLLKAGASPNEVNASNKETPLHVAARFGYEDVAVALLDGGANINFRSVQLETPLFIAARSNRLKLVHLLLERGASKTLANADSKDPLYIASEKGHKGVVGLLKAEKKYLSHALTEALHEERDKVPSAQSTEAMLASSTTFQPKPDRGAGKTPQPPRDPSPAGRAGSSGRPAAAAPEPVVPEIIPIEVPKPKEHTHDPLTGKKLPPCKTMVEAGAYDVQPDVEVKETKEMKASYGGTAMSVGGGTGEPVAQRPMFEPTNGDVFDYVVLPKGHEKPAS